MKLLDFGQLMIQKDFRKAAELLYAFATNVPPILVITADSEANISKINELENKLAHRHAQIDKMFEHLEFNQLLNQAIQTGNLHELWRKHKHNERSIAHVRERFELVLKDLKKEQYLKLFDDKVLSLKYSLKIS